jgi:hypothetical protein
MLHKLKENECQIIDISSRLDGEEDFDALVPDIHIKDEDYETIKNLERTRSEKIGMDFMPEEVFNQILETCFQQGGYKGFRDALLLVTQANWGVRIDDARIIKRIDFLNEHNKFRESCLFSELKTGKPRTMYINDAIKMCVLMVTWSGDFEPLDWLIVADWRNKNYRKVKDPITGKVLRNNGSYVYELDENGNRIVDPLSYSRIYEMLTNKLIIDLNIPLKGRKKCDGGKVRYATHSLRKLYSVKVEQLFQDIYGEMGQAHTAAMEFLNWDLNHSSISTTSRYCGDFESIKKEINMNMKLGYDVIKKYYNIEREKFLCSHSKH